MIRRSIDLVIALSVALAVFAAAPVRAQQAPAAPALTAEERMNALGRLYDRALQGERVANERAAVLEGQLEAANKTIAELRKAAAEKKPAEEKK